MKTTYPAQTRQCAHFRKACQRAGIHTPPNCGPAVRDVLLSLRASPLLLNTGRNKDYHRARPTDQPLIGMAIKTGFARFVADEKCYVITPAGETWLNELEIHGLLEGKAESGNVKAEMKDAA